MTPNPQETPEQKLTRLQIEKIEGEKKNANWLLGCGCGFLLFCVLGGILLTAFN